MKDYVMFWIGLLAVGIYFLFIWVREAFKATKDPEVIEATELRMDIRRYKKYKDMSERISKVYKEYGLNSSIAEKKVNDIIKEAPNYNEFDRYQRYRMQKDREEIFRNFGIK